MTRKELGQGITLRDEIRKRRLTWFGHVKRMEGKRLQGCNDAETEKELAMEAFEHTDECTLTRNSAPETDSSTLIKRSVSGTSGGRRISNTRGPLSDVVEAAATIVHNLRFTKPIARDPNSRTRSVARFVFMVFRFERVPRRQFFFKLVVNVS